MRILGIDTSTSAATAAILNDEKLEAEIFLNHKMQHSIILFPMLEKLLKMLELKIQDIDAVAVSGGPGSFTGLRIGVSAAKGIAQGGSKKFVAVSSLDAIAFQQVGFDGIICPILDGLRDNVYTRLFSWQGGELFNLYDYDALHIDELLKKISERNDRIMFCGDAVKIHRERIQDRLGERAIFAPLSTTMPRAASIAELGKIKLDKGVEDDIYTYSPIYIRKPQAEREYERKLGVCND
ncbi:MAG: tsaB [Clostridiales bacterium]|jgi:tRNA threonylcarbamoyl adenosine modification protein YeaZ|nr:tsaB [Clostridiales bacterium]